MATEKKLFHRAHYNILAKRIREQYDAIPAKFGAHSDTNPATSVARKTLEDLAIQLCIKLTADNSEFDPNLFLENCGMEIRV